MTSSVLNSDSPSCLFKPYRNTKFEFQNRCFCLYLADALPLIIPEIEFVPPATLTDQPSTASHNGTAYGPFFVRFGPIFNVRVVVTALSFLVRAACTCVNVRSTAIGYIAGIAASA